MLSLLSKAFAVIFWVIALVLAAGAIGLALTGVGIPAAAILGFGAWLCVASGAVCWRAEY